MKVLLVFLLWCLLLVLCWPVAVLALLLVPFVLLGALLLRVLGVCFEGLFALLRALLLLPARLLGHRS
jgi:hypothetical protein